MVRHDIRNDLQLVTAYAELVEEHVDEEARGYLETVRESAAHAVELTESARILADIMLQTDLDDQYTSLAPALERALEDLRSAFPGAAIEVEES